MARTAEETRVKATEEEDRDWTEQYLTGLEEEEDRFWDGEADVVDDSEAEIDDDVEMLDVAEEGEVEAEAEAATVEEEEWVSGPAWDPEEKNMMRPMREESPAVPEVSLVRPEAAVEPQVEVGKVQKPPKMSAADKEIIAGGFALGASSLATASRTTTGNLGASRRSSRHNAGDQT
jgi:hypothetical protein